MFQIVFSREAGDAPGASEPGDLIFVLACAAHPLFQREGNDLIMPKAVALRGGRVR